MFFVSIILYKHYKANITSKPRLLTVMNEMDLLVKELKCHQGVYIITRQQVNVHLASIYRVIVIALNFCWTILFYKVFCPLFGCFYFDTYKSSTKKTTLSRLTKIGFGAGRS